MCLLCCWVSVWVVVVLCGNSDRKCLNCFVLNWQLGGNCYRNGLSLCCSVSILDVKKLVSVGIVVLLWKCSMWVRQCGFLMVKIKLLGVVLCQVCQFVIDCSEQCELLILMVLNWCDVYFSLWCCVRFFGQNMLCYFVQCYFEMLMCMVIVVFCVGDVFYQLWWLFGQGGVVVFVCYVCY